MRVFVTGATGFIGSAVVEDLLAAGHQVVGLARSDASAKFLESLGVEVFCGSLDDLDSLKRGATASDGVIHCGFIHDFSDYATSVKKDLLAIQTLGAALEGSDRPFVVTSSTLVLPPIPDHLGMEDDTGDLKSPTSARLPSEELTLSFVSKGVRSSVIRLPPSVHGKGDHSFIPTLIGVAREKGVSAYIGEGLNHWPAMHRLDAARLYRLVLEKGTAGARYHAVADEGVPLCDIARVIGKHLSIPVVSKSPEEAADHFGWIGAFASIGSPISSKKTREQLGWHPSQPTLMADLEQNYF